MTSNSHQFVTPAPYPVVGSNRQVRSKLQRESSDVKSSWIPAFAGMTFLEAALSFRFFILLIFAPKFKPKEALRKLLSLQNKK
jgi:hypothetical protein